MLSAETEVEMFGEQQYDRQQDATAEQQKGAHELTHIQRIGQLSFQITCDN